MFKRLRAWWSNWWAERRCTKCGSLWHKGGAHCPAHGLLINDLFGCAECEHLHTQAVAAHKARVASRLKQQEYEALADAIAEKIVEKLKGKD